MFDYDGLLADTEQAEFEAWCGLYAAHGAVLTAREWTEAVGHVNHVDPRALLELKTGRTLDWAVLDPQKASRHHELVAALPLLPGVRDLIDRARAAGLRVAVVSNSGRTWVSAELARLGLASDADIVVTRDDVARFKPFPDPYLRVLDLLGIGAEDAVAFEDSAPGVASAKAAGVWVVAVPNALTALHDLDAADERIASLAHWPVS